MEDYHEGHASSVIATEDGGYAVMGSLDNTIWLAKFAPESNTSPDGSSPIPATLIIDIFIMVIIVAVVGSLLVYFKKRKH